MNRMLTTEDQEVLLAVLQKRFEKNTGRHANILWPDVHARLKAHTDKLWSLNEMEQTGGEPDVIGYDEQTGGYLFCDCSAESPSGRRSLCYDQKALDARKEHKPVNSAVEMAAEMGIELMNESQYRELQRLGKFDCKTSSWLVTPTEIRKLGGSIFGDRRYNQVFVYHNGAQSYYAARGFRGMLLV